MTASPFGSTLSVGGFVAASEAGLRPLQQVQGSSIVSLGRQQNPSRRMRGALAPQKMEGVFGSTQVYYPRGSLTAQEYLNEGGWVELEERTAAYNSARTGALARLRKAAAEAGAFAVVDVRVRSGRFEQAVRAIEFTAIGTAVASDRFESDDALPLTSLSGGELWKLLAAGAWPIGLVGGTSVVYVVAGLRTKYARFRLSRRSLRNQEYEDYTNGLVAARRRAMGRLNREARAAEATGVLGIKVGRERREQQDENLLVTVDVLGTAIVRVERAAPIDVQAAIDLGAS